jgi:CRISPR-associated protein Cas6
MESQAIDGAGKSPLVRRTLEIAGRTVVGYAVEVSGLTAEESIILQENGIGGRRRFGCGIFIPARD